jgi:predicted nucleic acid-binding protein
MKKGPKEEKPGLRVVLDTNVYISVFNYPDSPLREVWQHARRGTFEPLISPAIVNELGRVLRDQFLWSETHARLRLKYVVKPAQIIVPSTVPDVIKNDPDDNHILACALVSQPNLMNIRVRPNSDTICRPDPNT